jgi:hypothetical protein
MGVAPDQPPRTDRPSVLSRLRVRQRALVWTAIALAVAAAVVIAVVVAARRPAPAKTADCYTALEEYFAGAPGVSVTVRQASKAEAACEELWVKGVLRDRNTGDPANVHFRVLQACTLSNGRIVVFPRQNRSCVALGLR